VSRRIAIVGAGQAGLQLGFGLLAEGAAVTLVAERSADEVFAGRLAATAGLFASAIALERELGLDLWADEAPLIDGVHIDFCIAPRNLLLTVEGRFNGPCRAVDHRLKMSTWMRELERRGGRLILRAAGARVFKQVAWRITPQPPDTPAAFSAPTAALACGPPGEGRRRGGRILTGSRQYGLLAAKLPHVRILASS
jgi:hypothetical protein